MSLVVLLTGLVFLYVIGIFGASNNPLEFLSVIFLLILGVGSRIMMGFSLPYGYLDQGLTISLMFL